MLRRLLVLLAKSLLVFAVVWLVVIGYWQYTRRVVSSSDLLVYLALLPLGLLVSYWLARGVFAAGKKIQARRRSKAESSPANAGAPNPDSAAPGPQAGKPLLVIGSALCSGMGDAETWIEKARDYEIHHQLDQTLTDALGWAVRSVRADDVDEPPSDDEALPDDMQAGVKRMARMLGRVREDLSDVLGRASRQAALAQRTPSAVDQRVVLHPEWTGQAVSHAEAGPAPVVAEITGVSTLAVFLFLPGFVTDSEAAALETATREWALETGWPQDKVAVTRISAHDPSPSLKRLGEILQQQLLRPGQLLVLLSAVSWLDESLLAEQLERNAAWAERLQKASTIVGEAAAGMVLAAHPLVDPATREQSPALAHLTGLSIGERQKPIDVKGSVEAELLAALSQALGKSHGISPDQYRRLVATGDLWRGRPVELGRWLSDCLPHLSLVDDSIQVGQHMGECDPVADLVALVLAVESCRQADAPVLFCSNHSLSWRGLSAISPVAEAA